MSDLTPQPPLRRGEGETSHLLPLSAPERGLGGEVDPLPWEVLKTEYLLRTPWRSVRSDWLRIHTGDEVRYDYLEAPDAAFVVPVTVDGKVALIRQYRHPVQAWVWEIVGGGVGPEGPRESAVRELHEEIGGRCRELVPLGSYLMGAGAMTVRSHAFLALDVELGEAEREPMELVEVVLLDPDDAFERARDGRIDESQSALAILKAEPLIRAHLAARGATCASRSCMPPSGSVD